MKDQKQEIREAIDAGNRALYALDGAAQHLKTARGLGVWDLLGGGFLSSILKHSKMDDAQRAMEQAEYELRNFSRELGDVQMAVSMQVNFDGLTRFFDAFCDNFFVDFMVQNQIANAQDSVWQARMQVEEAIRQLQFMLG